jgi:hypothetical protein
VAAQRSGPSRSLDTVELDAVTVGAASSAIDVAAVSLSANPQSSTSTSTIAVSQSSPAAGLSALGILSAETSHLQGTASAGGLVAAVEGSSQILIAGASRGAFINVDGTAVAAGSAAGRAELSMQFDGITIGRVDFAFGTAIMHACCAPLVASQVSANGQGGPYSAALTGYTSSHLAGQSESRVDAAVASSTLPIIDPGQMTDLLSLRGFPN